MSSPHTHRLAVDAASETDRRAISSDASSSPRMEVRQPWFEDACRRVEAGAGRLECVVSRRCRR